MNHVFLDFEASSLLPGTFPIEIGWVTASGQGESYLIRPSPDWLLPTPQSRWDLSSERIHGISMAELEHSGTDLHVVARRACAAFLKPGAVVFADDPMDAHWLGMLTAAAGVQPVQVADIYGAYSHACRPLLQSLPPLEHPGRTDAVSRVQAEAAAIIARCQEAEAMKGGTRHRALPDAERLWRTWRAVSDAAQAYAWKAAPNGTGDAAGPDQSSTMFPRSPS